MWVSYDGARRQIIGYMSGEIIESDLANLYFRSEKSFAFHRKQSMSREVIKLSKGEKLFF